MTANEVLKNLKAMIGKEMDFDDVVCAFEDFEEGGETSVYVGESNNNGYDYIAYIDVPESTQFLIKVNHEDVIEDVWML